MEETVERIIREYGLDDTADIRDALTEVFMSGALKGAMDSDIFREALDFFSDEEEDED